MDPRGELLIYGYTRLIQNSTRLKQIIPIEIVELCYDFYQNEYFTEYGKNIMHDKYESIIKTENRRFFSPISAYGSIQISRDYLGIFSWTFKLLSPVKRIFIGIDSSNKYCINTELTKKYTFYVFNDEYIYNHINILDKYKSTYNSPYKWKTNDIIRMELNSKTKKICYYYNEEKEAKTVVHYVDFSNNKIYHMIVYFNYDKGYFSDVSSVQLTDFKFTKLK